MKSFSSMLLLSLTLTLFGCMTAPVQDQTNGVAEEGPMEAAPPAWVRTGGVDVPFDRDSHLVGFDRASKGGSENEPRELAKHRALDQLSRSVRIEVRSQMVTTLAGTKDQTTAAFTSAAVPESSEALLLVGPS